MDTVKFYLQYSNNINKESTKRVQYEEKLVYLFMKAQKSTMCILNCRILVIWHLIKQCIAKCLPGKIELIYFNTLNWVTSLVSKTNNLNISNMIWYTGFRVYVGEGTLENQKLVVLFKPDLKNTWRQVDPVRFWRTREKCLNVKLWEICIFLIQEYDDDTLINDKLKSVLLFYLIYVKYSIVRRRGHEQIRHAAHAHNMVYKCTDHRVCVCV